MKALHLVSIGTMYVDINCLHFPFQEGLFANRETTGAEYALQLGGSALNFAKATTQLGLQTTFIGKVGQDQMGNLLTKMMHENNIHPAIITDPTAQTNLAIHYVHKDGTSIMTSVGTANQLLTIQEIESQLHTTIESIDYLYLGGVFKLKKLLPHFAQLAKLAKAKKKKVILDHGRVNNNVTPADIEALQQLLPFIDIYLPSIDEFFDVWQVKTIEDGFTKVKQMSKADIVVKCGDEGAMAIKGDIAIKTPSFSVNVTNTVGAGDAFNAGYLTALKHGFDFEDCVRFACTTAAWRISSSGELTFETIHKLFKEHYK